MDISLIVNGLDLSKKLSTYSVSQEVSYRKVITTLDDVEHPYPGLIRPIVNFSLLPLTDGESADLYHALSPLLFTVKFWNPHINAEMTRQMRLVSNMETVFLLKSVDGKRRYRGGEIQLRAQ